jgi:hypothetical protein
MLQSNRPLSARIIARPIRYSWLLLPLLGFECVMSEQPLVPFEDGFVDPALVGTWIESGEDPDTSELLITLRDDGRMAVDVIQTDDNERPFYSYRGYAARLGDDTYANLELVAAGCQACTPAELESARAEFAEENFPIIAGTEAASCTYIVIRYEHTDDDRLIINWQDNTAVLSAIAQDRLEGRVFSEADGDFAGQPCVTTAPASCRTAGDPASGSTASPARCSA